MRTLILAALAAVALAAAAPLAADRGAHGLTLPASFSGVLPCADCPGIQYHLDVWPDQGYVLRREYLDRDLVVDETGRWHVDPARNALVLRGSDGAMSEWRIDANEALHLLDREGQPFESRLNYTLETGPLDPTDAALALSGMLVYFADAAVFTECLTGQTFPVMMEEDYVALERAYLEGRPAPAAPLLVRVEGTITEREQMEGPPRRSLVVSQFHHVTPDAGCASARGTPELTNTYWRLTHLGEIPVNPIAGRTEPHLLFLDGERSGVSGTIGCNTFRGGFERTGHTLQFSQVATTKMACPPGVDFLEAAFSRALGDTQAFEIVGQTLRLMGADSNETARLQAVYTPF